MRDDYAPLGDRRAIRAALPRALLRYVEQAAGREALAAVVQGQSLSAAQLDDRNRSFTSSETIALARCAELVCHDRRVGRGAGAEHFIAGCEHGLGDLLLAAGSVPAAVGAAAHRATKVETGRRLWVECAADDHLVLAGAYDDPSAGDEFYCSYTAGYFERFPSAFGLLGTAVEVDCQLHGAPACRFRLSWRSDHTRLPVSRNGSAPDTDRMELLVAQLEAARTLTSDLLSLDRVDELLVKITDRAGQLLQAPRYLLAVHLDGWELPLVRQRGFPAGEVDPFVARLLAGETSETDGVISAVVVSGGENHGQLAVCYPRHVTFTDIDRRLLEAYARHAGAVLEHAVALHQARGDRDTAAAVTAQNAQLVEQASHQAMHDPLTGLANRRLAREHGQKGIQAARRDGRAMAICVANLDRFKNVNDTLGHAAGDELLRSVALRIENAVRDGDVLARIGGDEFVILLPGVGGNVDARSTADRIIANLAEPFTVGGHELYVSASVGIACYPQHGLDFDTLLRHAGAATYAVKATGRDAIAVYADSAATDRAELLQIETELHRAISGGELQVYYQPQLDLRDGRMVAVEALVRWQHPRRGLLAPASFLALAEESGLIAEIDAFVRRTAFGQIRSWLDRGHELYVAVNMSTRDLSDPGLLATLVDETSAAGLDPTHVELEITERVAIDNVHLKPVLAELSRAGFRLAIDDFGTGNSVLGRLNGTQVDTLKIDQSFVRDIVDEASATPVVQAITSLARNLRIDTVAEGVEESHQVPVLLRCGARIGQGYLFCRPVPADEVGRLLAYPPIAPGAQRLVAMS